MPFRVTFDVLLFLNVFKPVKSNKDFIFNIQITDFII